MFLEAPKTTSLPTFEQVMKRAQMTQLPAPSTSEALLSFTAVENRFTRQMTIRETHGKALSALDVFVDGKRCLRGVTDGRTVHISAPRLGLVATVPLASVGTFSIGGVRFQRNGKHLSLDLMVQTGIDNTFKTVKWKTVRKAGDFYEGRAAQRIDFEGLFGTHPDTLTMKVSAWVTDSGRTVPFLTMTTPEVEITGAYRSYKGAQSATMSGFSGLQTVPLSVFKAKCRDVFNTTGSTEQTSAKAGQGESTPTPTQQAGG